MASHSEGKHIVNKLAKVIKNKDAYSGNLKSRNSGGGSGAAAIKHSSLGHSTHTQQH